MHLCYKILNLHLEHQKELFHNFIDFKKAFDRVWHAELVMASAES